MTGCFGQFAGGVENFPFTHFLVGLVEPLVVEFAVGVVPLPEAGFFAVFESSTGEGLTVFPKPLPWAHHDSRIIFTRSFEVAVF